MSGHLADLGTTLTTMFLLAGAVVIVLLLVTEYAKRLREHVDTRIDAVRFAVRKELSEQDVRLKRYEERIRGLETDLFELTRTQANDAARFNQAMTNFLKAMAELEEDKAAIRNLRKRRRQRQARNEKKVS